MPMASSVISGHVSRALDFYNTSNIYFGLGKTTSWSSDSTPTSNPTNNDENPPEPTSTDTLQENRWTTSRRQRIRRTFRH